MTPSLNSDLSQLVMGTPTSVCTKMFLYTYAYFFYFYFLRICPSCHTKAVAQMSIVNAG